MRVGSITLLALLLALCVGASDLRSEEDAKVSTTADLVLGDYWHGAEISKEDLQGKVVLFVIWGS